MQVEMDTVGALQPTPSNADTKRTDAAKPVAETMTGGDPVARREGVDLAISDRLRADLRFLQEKRAQTSAALDRVGQLQTEIETIRDRIHGFWNQLNAARDAAGPHLPPPFGDAPHPAYQALVDVYDEVQAIHAETYVSEPGAVVSAALEGLTNEVRIYRDPTSDEVVSRTKPIETVSGSYTAYWIAEPVTIPEVDEAAIVGALAPYGEAVADVDRDDPIRLGSTLRANEHREILDAFRAANNEIRTLVGAYHVAAGRLEDKLAHVSTMIAERRAELGAARPVASIARLDIDPAEIAAQLRSNPALARLAQARVEPGRAHALLAAPPPPPPSSAPPPGSFEAEVFALDRARESAVDDHRQVGLVLQSSHKMNELLDEMHALANEAATDDTLGAQGRAALESLYREARHEFTLIASGTTFLSGELKDALIEAGAPGPSGFADFIDIWRQLGAGEEFYLGGGFTQTGATNFARFIDRSLGSNTSTILDAHDTLSERLENRIRTLAAEKENRMASKASREQVAAAVSAISLTPTQLEAVHERARAAIAQSGVFASLPW